MDIIDKMLFSKYLEDQFLLWQQKEGGRRTVTQFSEWLGFPQSTVSTWMNKSSTPKDGDIIRKLSERLGFEVFDVLGLPRPDEDLAYISQHWDEVSEEFRRKFREEVEKQLEHESKKLSKDRRAHAHS